MQPLQKFSRIILLISLSVWLIGCGGGGGGSPSITGVHISRLYVSPTYESEVFLSGSFSIKSPDEAQFSRTVTITWHNQLTGESGSDQRLIEGSCIWLIFPDEDTIFCGVHGDDTFDFVVPLIPGNNKITVTASMKGSEAQDSVTVIRTPPDETVLPHVETLPATEIGISSAKLQGLVNPNLWAFFDIAEVWFEYSTDPGLESAVSTTIDQLEGVINVNIAFSETVSYLEEDTTYFYRSVARNKYGTVWGAILNFTTPLLPTVTTSPAIQLLPREATVSGTVNPNGYDTDAWFELGFDPEFFAYVTTSPMIGTGAGTIPIQVDQLFDQLSTSTEYYYRLTPQILQEQSEGTH